MTTTDEPSTAAPAAPFTALGEAYFAGIRAGHSEGRADVQRERSEAVSAAFARGQAAALAFPAPVPDQRPRRVAGLVLLLLVGACAFELGRSLGEGNDPSLTQPAAIELEDDQ